MLTETNPKVLDSYTVKTPNYSPEKAYLKIQEYIDALLREGICSTNEVRRLCIQENNLSCLPAIIFLNRFSEDSGLHFVPVKTVNGITYLDTVYTTEFYVLDKYVSKKSRFDFEDLD